ncbi:unnamed protein product [Plutella xylostella]|uniref:(diamondback moth) hypothetical protein n=1 Tax=Plutella xylostella TaxID=51655 RepID=A0A8S4D1L8_PLUXY|nr:unnamed protein product [Plutella xylostella]
MWPSPPLSRSIEGAKWKVCEVYWSERALLVGSEDGGVAAVTSRAPHVAIAAAFPFNAVFMANRHIVTLKKLSSAEERIIVEGAKWKVCEVYWSERALLVGSEDVAVAAAFPFNKLIHCIDWHPQQVSESNEESPLKNLIAVSSLDKQNAIAILELSEKEDGNIGLSSWKKLTGHKGAVLRVAWNPHRDGILLSSSQDCTVRVWDVVQGVCTSIFGGHSASALSAAWLAAPALAAAALSGGGDCCLRVFRTSDHPADMYDGVCTSIFGGHSASALSAAWLAAPALAAAALSGGGDCCLRVFRTSDHPADMYDESKHEGAIALAKIKTKKNKKATDAPKAATLEDENPPEDTAKVTVKETIQKDDEASHDEEEVAIVANAGKDKKSKPSSKFLVSYQNKYSTHSLQACRKLLSRIKNKDEKVNDTDDCEIKFVKMFGSTNEVNELLDEEAERHISFKNHESWIMLSIFRGNMDKVFEYASEKDMICPFLLSIAPCVSFKYWKDTTQLYLAQLERLIAKGDDSKLNAQKSYGGAVYRKVAVLLAVHDARAAVSELRQRGLFTEAYLLARTRCHRYCTCKVAVLLAVHDARAAVAELRSRGLFTEAYLLARTRYVQCSKIDNAHRTL